MHYLKIQTAAMYVISLICLGCVAVSVFYAQTAETRVMSVEQQLEALREDSAALTGEVERLRLKQQNLDVMCTAQYDWGWEDAEAEYETLGDPPYYDWGC